MVKRQGARGGAGGSFIEQASSIAGTPTTGHLSSRGVLPVMIMCPSTMDMAWTGLATARPTLNHLGAGSVFTFECPVCKGQHRWTRADAWLDDELEDDEAEQPAA